MHWWLRADAGRELITLGSPIALDDRCLDHTLTEIGAAASPTGRPGVPARAVVRRHSKEGLDKLIMESRQTAGSLSADKECADDRLVERGAVCVFGVQAD